MLLIVVYDKVAEESGPVYEAKNEAIAQRMYRAFMSKPGMTDASDFRLLSLGSIDHQTQVVRLHEVPEDITPEGGAL